MYPPEAELEASSPRNVVFDKGAALCYDPGEVGREGGVGSGGNGEMERRGMVQGLRGNVGGGEVGVGGGNTVADGLGGAAAVEMGHGDGEGKGERPVSELVGDVYRPYRPAGVLS